MQVTILETNTEGKGLYKGTVYSIQVMPGKFTIKRRYEDFVRLRKLVVAKNVPEMNVPPLPRGRIFGLFNPILIEYRKQEFQKFLDFVSTHPVFYDDLLKDWLGLVSSTTNPIQVVMDKLAATATQGTDVSFLEAKARSLCEKDIMKSMYLDFDWDTTKRIYFETTRSLASSNSEESSSSSSNIASSIVPPLISGAAEPSTSQQSNPNFPTSAPEGGTTSKPSINPVAALFVSPMASISGVDTVKTQSQLVSAAVNTHSSPEGTLHASAAADGDGTIDDSIPKFDEDESTFFSNFNPSLEKNKKQKLRIKLVITEITHKNSTKSLRRILCPIMETIGPYVDKTLPRFGMFHSALIVGPWYIDWNASELCVPRKIMSRAALLSCDIDGIAVEKERIEDIRNSLSQVICHWNSTKHYRNDPKDRTVEGNCQDFVDDILAHLGIDASSVFNGALGDYLKEMRTKGVCEIAFKLTPEFRQEFGRQESIVKFESHAELDTFVNSLLQKERDFRRKYPQEWSLLKSFDRAFWLRNLKDPQVPQYQPLAPQEDGKVIGCPFDNPINTASFAMDRF